MRLFGELQIKNTFKESPLIYKVECYAHCNIFKHYNFKLLKQTNYI